MDIGEDTNFPMAAIAALVMLCMVFMCIFLLSIFLKGGAV